MMHRQSFYVSAVFIAGWAWACSDTAPPTMAGNAGSTMTLAGSASVGGAGSPAVVGTSGSSVTVAGSGGGAGSGGVSAGGSVSAGGGAGGAAVVTPYVPPVSKVSCPASHVGGTDPLIADFEDGLKIIEADGRAGIWFGYDDGTGTTSAPAVVTDMGGKALRVTGEGFMSWGSGLGSSIAFDFGKSAQCPYDASMFEGVTVRVKGEGLVRLRVTQVDMTPATATDRKGSCDPNKTVCEGHYEVPITLTSSWEVHELAWQDFKQPFGTPVPFDPQQVLGLNFEFNSLTEYDLWLDDVAFLQAGAGGSGAGGESASGGNAAGGESN